MRTGPKGAVCESITSLPYGDMQSPSGSCGDPSPLHFTGKQRDPETGLDDFGARYYSSTQGRWYSPDWDSAQVPVPYADLHNPQTLNLYAYVGGDPTNHADADGHLSNAPGDTGDAKANGGCPTTYNASTCPAAQPAIAQADDKTVAKTAQKLKINIIFSGSVSSPPYVCRSIRGLE